MTSKISKVCARNKRLQDRWDQQSSVVKNPLAVVVECLTVRVECNKVQ